MIAPWLLLVQQAAPGDCMLTGLCGILQPQRAVASGVMFVAVGLVAMGVWGLRTRRSPPDQ